MTELRRLESDDPEVAGFLATFPSRTSLSTHWRSGVPIYPTKEAAQQYAASVLQRLLDRGLTDDAERTNWVSFVAAVQRIVSDFNEQLTKRIHGSAGNLIDGR